MKYFWKNCDGMAFAQDIINNNQHNHHNGFIKDVESSSDDTRPEKKMKRFRSAFTTDQINYLEGEFKKLPYIGNVHRKEVAAALKLSERAVKIWFQNRRMKEKKDSITKEVHDETKICLSPKENANKPLNNCLTTPSTNDQKAYSLPTLISTNLADTNSRVFENVKPIAINLTTPIEANHNKETTYFQNQLPSSNFIHKTNSVPKIKSPDNDHTTTAEFSISLCKRVKSDSDKCVKIKESNVSNQKVEETKEIKTNCKEFPNVPEDLTSHKRRGMPPEQNPVLKVVPNPEYIPILPNFYPQPYVPSGGLLWNPINVMPLMSTGASAVTIPGNHNGLSVGQDNAKPRVNCTCNCHLRTHPVPMAFQQHHLGPQYVFTAVPLQNPSP